MKASARIKPSKPASAVGLVAGLVFVGIGLFVVVPHTGAFGVLWTLFAVVITVIHGANLFSARGIADEVGELDTTGSISDAPSPSSKTAEQRLDDLDALRKEGRITA